MAAKQNVTKSQRHQKHQCDKKTSLFGVKVMIFMAHETQGKQLWPLPCSCTFNCATVCPVDSVDDKTVMVNLDRVTCCPDKLEDITWLGPHSRRTSSEEEEEIWCWEA